MKCEDRRQLRYQAYTDHIHIHSSLCQSLRAFIRSSFIRSSALNAPTGLLEAAYCELLVSIVSSIIILVLDIEKLIHDMNPIDRVSFLMVPIKG